MQHACEFSFVYVCSADDAASCNSSKMSNKSEKNMADFDGEDDDESGCDDELVQLAAQAHLGSHQMQQHLANMTSSVYHLHHAKCMHCKILVSLHIHCQASNFDVCRP